MGRFTLLLMLAYMLYTWLPDGRAGRRALGSTNYYVPFIVVCCAILFVFVRVSGYPARFFFGLTRCRAPAATCARAVFFPTLPWLAGARRC